MYHNPVLLKESIEGLKIEPDGTYVDATYGGGGHAAGLLKKLRNGKLLAFDQDEDAKANIIDDERLIFVNHNFRYLKNFSKYYKLIPVDGILADLGLSSHQIDTYERGFSIRSSGRLDLRMNRNQEKTAGFVLNEYSEEDLKRIIYDYAELKNAASIASRIVTARKKKAILGFDDLRSAISSFAPAGRENRFYARLLQALRIEINDEIGALKEFLEQSLEVLKKGGRLVIISYHSLEDRPVKNFMKYGNFSGQIKKDFYGKVSTSFRMINKKPLTPSDEEIKNNNRARSAKLRIAEKL